MASKSSKTRRGKLGQDGVAAVELAIIVPILILFIAAILDFGHAWYVQHAVIAASREGARQAIVYRNLIGTNTRAAPSQFSTGTTGCPSIAQVVDDFLGPPDGPFGQKIWTFTPSGLGWTVAAAGNEVTITVSIIKPWYMLGGWFGIDPNVTIWGSSTMRLE